MLTSWYMPGIIFPYKCLQYKIFNSIQYTFLYKYLLPANNINNTCVHVVDFLHSAPKMFDFIQILCYLSSLLFKILYCFQFISILVLLNCCHLDILHKYNITSQQILNVSIIAVTSESIIFHLNKLSLRIFALQISWSVLSTIPLDSCCKFNLL